MDKTSVKRSDLKHNFLKRIIIRADFRGVDEDEIAQSLASIKEYLKDKQYIRSRKETANEIDYRLDDPQPGEIPVPIPSSIRRTEVHVFQNEEPGVSVRLSASFVLIVIESAKYKNCLTYCENIHDLLNMIKDKASFFELYRFGIRKTNQCIIWDKSLINKYFEPHVLSLYKGCQNLSQSKVSESRDFFSLNNSFDVNFVRTIVCGVASDGRNAYQLTLDSDIYVLEEQCSGLIDNFTDKSNEMNEYLFCVYKDSITKDFICLLSKEEFENHNEVSGVDRND